MGDGGAKDVFSQGSEIPVENIIVGTLVEEPSEMLDLCGCELLGPQGLPACGSSS